MTQENLLKELKQSKPFESLETETVINVMRTYEWLTGNLSGVFKAFGLTHPQYNVLRILVGAGKEGLSCNEIGDRMVNRVPDITRLVDRLEAKGWVTRIRSTEDRRVVHVVIAGSGKEVVKKLQKPLLELQKGLFENITQTDQRELNRILYQIRFESE